MRGGQLFGRGALFGVLQRSRGVGEPDFERLQCLFGIAHLLRERFTGRTTLPFFGVVLCLTRRELRGSRHHLRRLPPLRVLHRRLRVGQLLREDVVVGDCLSEPDFDLTLAP